MLYCHQHISSNNSYLQGDRDEANHAHPASVFFEDEHRQIIV
jgi:hypothetical protein